jgi:hypothetical protein
MTAKIMLDSGAFSAWTRNKIIDLDEYISFIKRFEDDLESYVNLDVIPGKPGSQPTPKEVDFSANEGWNNYLKMIEEGLNPIPVFHFGEDIKWLETMLDFGVKYIGLGGIVGRPQKLIKKWLDKIFDVLTDDKGRVYAKIHGFGITTTWALNRYPWYSVDSVSWRILATNGWSVIPQYNHSKKEFTYDKPPFTIVTSVKSKKKYLRNQHIDTVNLEIKKLYSKYVNSLSITEKELASKDPKFRLICNAIYYYAIADYAQSTIFTKPKTIFTKPKKSYSVVADLKSKIIMYLGIGSPKDTAIFQDRIPEPQVLISYLACPKQVSDDYFKKYIKEDIEAQSC